MIISSSGYYATGSSAIYDLLNEYECNTNGVIGEKEYEHVIFYTPGGLFDLEDKLLKGNSIHRSDEAIKTFEIEMKRLYVNNFGWFGSYKNILGKDFWDINQVFIEGLIQFRVDAHWSYHIKKMGFSIKKIKYSIKNFIKGKKIRGRFWEGYFYENNNEILYSFPTKEEFARLAKKYIYDYVKCIKGDKTEKNTVFNHLVLPQNANRIMEYGLADFYVIIVDRDPRDVYAYIKYVGKIRGVKSRIPTNIYEFISFWKAMRKEPQINSSNILNIQFEDLIYKYEETVRRIECFLGLSNEEHVKRGCFFEPMVSIENTQIYKKVKMNKNELILLENELSEYLYDFPERESTKEIFPEALGNLHLLKRGDY